MQTELDLQKAAHPARVVEAAAEVKSYASGLVLSYPTPPQMLVEAGCVVDVKLDVRMVDDDDDELAGE